MPSVKLDTSKLLGFKLLKERAADSGQRSALGSKVGVKVVTSAMPATPVGAKIGQKFGAKIGQKTRPGQ